MSAVINLRSMSNPSCLILFPGKICSNHSSLEMFVNTSSNSAQCQLSFPLASLIRARVNQSSLGKIHSLARHCFSVSLTSIPVRTTSVTQPKVSQRRRGKETR